MGFSTIVSGPGVNAVEYINTIGPRVSKWMGKKVSWGDAVIGYNAFVCASVFASYLFTPNASRVEYLFDVSVHGTQAVLCLVAKKYPEQAKKIHAFLLTLNASQLASIFMHFQAGDSTIPAALNFIDASFNHTVMGGGYNVSILLSDKPANEKKES